MLSLGLAAQANAQRALISSGVLKTESVPGDLEGACGIAIRAGALYVSDYYHHGVDVFVPPIDNGPYVFQSRIPFDPLDGPCQLASQEGGALYANSWHEGASRLLPSVFSLDSGESTGVAVDQATGDVYVNDRTYVALYSSPVEAGELPSQKIGLGTLADAYGLAVFEGKVYVPDAADKAVKVYEPATDPINPAFTINGSATPKGAFSSLVDASVAVDPTNGHVLLTDNLQPGFEHPEAVIYEFDATGASLGQLSKKVIDGGPSGMAFSGSDLFVTSGNSDESNALQFGPYTEGLFSAGEGQAQADAPSPQPQPQSAGIPARSAASKPSSPAKRQGSSEAVVIQRGGIKVSFDGRLAPKKLPRKGSAPVRVSVAAEIGATDEAKPPQLKTISIAINRYGHFDPTGLPICTERDIQPATTQNALKACRDSLVGVGSFSASVALSKQSPFPAEGKMHAFNGRVNGKPAILAHVYGTNPVPTSFTFPFVIKPTKGTFGTVLVANLPQATGSSGYVTGLSMNLGRNYSFQGKRRSYLSASCPAPEGISKAPFSLAHATFDFKGGRSIGSTLVRTCGVR